MPVARFALQFFQLRTQLAGGFFQKFQNYRMRLAIMGDISAHISGSKALQDFVTETNRKGHHLFAADRADLETRLLR